MSAADKAAALAALKAAEAALAAAESAVEADTQAAPAVTTTKYFDQGPTYLGPCAVNGA